MLCWSASAAAQTTTNPFEITARMQQTREPTEVNEPVEATEVNVEAIAPVAVEAVEEETETEEGIAVTEGLVIDLDNPFEMIAPSAKRNSNTESKPTPTVAPAIEKPSPVKKVQTTAKDNGPLFGTILGLSLLLAFLFAGFRSSFNKAYQNITNSNILKQSYREMSTIGQLPLNIWYVFSWISMGVFVFLLMRHYGAGFTDSYFGNLGACIGIVFGLMLLKHAVLFFIGTIFPTQKEVQLYNFLIVIFGVALGVFLVPANISIAYLPKNMVSYAIYIVSGIIVLLYLLRAIRGLMISNRLFSFHRFHFLLYICAVEIAPVIILLKLGFLSAGK